MFKMKYILIKLFFLVEILLVPLTIISALWMKIITRIKLHRAIISEKIFMSIGVLPVADHYYQPMINPRKRLEKSLREDRTLPGIDFNIRAQLDLLSKFNYNQELLEISASVKKDPIPFHFNNGSFNSGDSEFLYNMLRYFKPEKMIEIGSGNSTLISIKAFDKNKEENSQYKVEHICIEPYEQSWLEQTKAKIIRKKVEDLEKDIFLSLKKNDILFIDSSHMIRPQGDVLFEYLEVLPILNEGVIVHIHDIFTPKDYLNEWVVQEHRLWNEQYLLEAFLSLNPSYEIMGALNYLSHHQRVALELKCPIFAGELDREPGSFWLRRTHNIEKCTCLEDTLRNRLTPV